MTKWPNLEGCIAAERAGLSVKKTTDEMARGASKYTPRTQRWSQRRLRRSVFAAGFWLAGVTGGVAQLLVVMREHLLILALFATAASAAEPQVNACPPAWPRDHERFRQETIYFRPGSSLLSTEAKRKIAEVATFLKAHPSTALDVEGHCDDRGSEEHNRWLGDRRARAAAKELVRSGISPDRIDTISFGEDRPLAAGHDAKARKKNRCAEFVLLRPPIPEDLSAHNEQR